MKIAQGWLVPGVLSAIVLLSGCLGSKPVGQNDLLYHNFTLAEVNGKPFSGEKIPNIQFNEGFQISGAVCNAYTGQAEMTGGILSAPQLASTKMLCFDQELNELEFAFGNMMMAGARLKLENGLLTLEGEGVRLKFKSADYVN